jgi:phytoene desaturase
MWGLVNYLEHRFGVYYIHGGAQAMANKMAEKIKSSGGQVTLNTTVNKILTKGARAIGVQLESGEKISADYVVSNADLQNTYDNLLGHKKKKRWTKHKLDTKNWSMSLFVWHFGTSKTRSKWKNVGHHTILVGPNYKKEVNDIFIKGELPQEMSLYVHRPSVTDKTCAPKGDDTFYVLACVPNLSFKNNIYWRNIEKSYKKKILDVLETRLLPGLGRSIKTEYVMTPLDFKERYLSHFGSGFSLEPQMFQSAWFRPHNKSEELDNLFLVGAGTHPGPGLPGVLASAEILDEILPDLKQGTNKRGYSANKKVTQV